MAKKRLEPSTALLLTPVVLVTCADAGGKANIITLAWAGVVNSAPPMISISIRPERHSHGIIEKTGEFTANLPCGKILKETDFCGVVSGNRVDKFSAARLTPLPAMQIKSPLIRECPVNLECRVKQIIPLGSHNLFLGEVVALHVDEEIQDPQGKVDISLAQPIAYSPLAREYWSMGEKIGRYGFSKGQMD